MTLSRYKQSWGGPRPSAVTRICTRSTWMIESRLSNKGQHTILRAFDVQTKKSFGQIHFAMLHNSFERKRDRQVPNRRETGVQFRQESLSWAMEVELVRSRLTPQTGMLLQIIVRLWYYTFKRVQQWLSYALTTGYRRLPLLVVGYHCSLPLCISRSLLRG